MNQDMYYNDPSKNQISETKPDESMISESEMMENNKSEIYTQEMDNETIMIAYKLIKEAAEKIGQLSNKVYTASEYCSEKDFAVKGITYEESIGNCSDCFEFVAKNIDEYADLLLDTLNSQIRQEEWTQEERRMELEPIQEYNVVVPR